MALTTIDDRGLKTPIDLLDNEKIRFGTGNDLELYHDGSHSYIYNSGTGNLQIKSDASLEFNTGGTANAIWCDTGAGVKLYYDNTLKFQTTSDGWKGADNVKGVFGDGDDLVIYHSGSNSFIQGGTGNIRIQQKVGEDGIVAIPDGAIELYYDNVKKFETLTGGASVTGDFSTSGDIKITGDGAGCKLEIGAGQDFQAYHDSHNYLDSLGTAELRIRVKENESALIAKPDGAVELYHNGTKQFQTIDGGFNLQDNFKAEFGNSGDLKIYHDGSNSYIQDSGTGALKLTSDQFIVSNAANDEYMIIGDQNDSVKLYHNGTKTFETTSGGAKTFGTVEITANEASDCNIYMHADEGDDNADQWLVQAHTDGSWNILNYADGAWETSIKATGGGAVKLYHNNGQKFTTQSWGAQVTGNFLPDGDNNYNLGASNERWANVYSADIHLNNTGAGGNEVDGSEGSWTIQEGANDLFLLNRTNGKKYKFNLTEIT